MAHTPEPFRFLDLPRELRDEIYSILLCSFEPRGCEPTSLPVPHPVIAPLGDNINSICKAEHNIDTTILRTSKQVHREAYDVMVKTNQFMHIRATGIPINLLLVLYQIPVVTMDRQHASQFKGYMLELHTYSGDSVSDEESGHRVANVDRAKFDLMILGRDWPLFCKMLSQADAHLPNFSGYMTLMDVSLKPPGDWCSHPDYKSGIKDFFEAKVQQKILKPFRMLRGFPNVSVDGHLASELMDIIDDEVGGLRFVDTTNFLQTFTRYKEKGDEHLKAGDLKAAAFQYGEAIAEWRNLRRGTSWTSVLEKGGLSFLNTAGELYARILLNAAQNSLKWMQTPEVIRNKPLQTRLGDGTIAILKELLHHPSDVMRNRGTWAMTSQQKTRAHYRLALCFRLVGRARDLAAAWNCILIASNNAPNDALVSQELQLIKDWGRGIGQDLVR